MAYRLNEDNSILYNGNNADLKAANDIGKVVLVEILKILTKSRNPIDVLELKHKPKQKVWVNVKDQYVLFDLTTNDSGAKLVEEYQGKKDTTEFAADSDTKVVNISGGVLTTDGGIPISSNQNVTMDVPKDADVKQKKT